MVLLSGILLSSICFLSLSAVSISDKSSTRRFRSRQVRAAPTADTRPPNNTPRPAHTVTTIQKSKHDAAEKSHTNTLKAHRQAFLKLHMVHFSRVQEHFRFAPPSSLVPLNSHSHNSSDDIGYAPLITLRNACSRSFF